MRDETFSQNDTTGNSFDLSDEQLREALVGKGWTETTAFVEPGTPAAEAPKASETRSADAERKALEREELRRDGWRQHNVMAPDDALAREFLSAAAQKIKSKKILGALRAALDDPKLIKIGRKIRRLRGDAGDQVRKLLDL
jgi:hypothetical protein